MCRNPEQAYLERAIEEAEIEQAYDWFYDRYDEEDQKELIDRFENDPFEFIKEERCELNGN